MHVNRTTFVKLKYEGLHFHMGMGQFYLDKTNSKSNCIPIMFIYPIDLGYVYMYLLFKYIKITSINWTH